MAKKVGNATIWVNVHKSNEDQPDYRGKVTVNGVAHDMALWIDTSVGEMRWPLKISGQVTEEKE